MKSENKTIFILNRTDFSDISFPLILICALMHLKLFVCQNLLNCTTDRRLAYSELRLHITPLVSSEFSLLYLVDAM